MRRWIQASLMFLLSAASPVAFAAIQLYVEPDCPSPSSNVVLVAFTSASPLLRQQPISVTRTGSTFKVVGALTTIAGLLPPALPLKAPVGNLAVGSYTFDFFTQQEGPGGLGPEIFQGSFAFQVAAEPPPCTPVRLRVVAGSNQIALKGTMLAAPIEVRAIDEAGRGVPNLHLVIDRFAPPEEYALGQTGGPTVALSASQLTTDVSGVATFTAAAGQTAGGVQYNISWTQGNKALSVFVNFGIASSIPVAPSLPIVEYSNVQTGSYFVTGDLNEQEILDSGLIPGWKRTGGAWLAFQHATASTQPSIVAVCRFFSPGWYFAHFFSAFDAECVALRQDPSWIEESPEMFGAIVPLPAGCPIGSRAIHRTVRFSIPAGHRYTTSMALAQYEVANGAVQEGVGNPPVVMCGPD